MTVPDVSSLSYANAFKELSKKGFTNVKQKQEVSDRTPGTVIDQDPLRRARQPRAPRSR